VWKQAAPLVAGGDRVGAIEVFYLEARPVASEGPFLKEERTLLDYLAERLGRVIERAWAQEALQVTYEERENLEHVAKQHLEGERYEPVIALRSLTSPDITPAIQRGKVEKDEVLNELTERVKELQCLYNLETIIEKHEELEEVFGEFVKHLPPAWQYPDVTAASIQMNDQEYKTPNFQITDWQQVVPIIAGGDRVGQIRVCYLDERPEEDEGPFLKEERALIDNIARRLGLLIERIWAQEALHVTDEERAELETIINQGPAVVCLWRHAPGWPVDYVSGNVQQIGLEPQDFYAGRVSFTALIHPDDRDRVVTHLEQNPWEQIPVLVQEYRIGTSGAGSCWVEDRRWPRRNEQGTVTHYQGILTNITDRKQDCH